MLRFLPVVFLACAMFAASCSAPGGYQWMQENAPAVSFMGEPDCNMRQSSCMEIGLDNCEADDTTCAQEVGMYCGEIKKKCEKGMK